MPAARSSVPTATGTNLSLQIKGHTRELRAPRGNTHGVGGWLAAPVSYI
jgi:hypothetical protein